MIITVTSLKGGVGKSTITQNLAVAFAHMGYKVAVVDADTNLSSVRWSGLRPEDLPTIFTAGYPDGKELAANIKPINQNYDLVFIDGTPSLSKVTSKILLIADLVLIPILPSGLDVWATEQFLERFQEACDQREEAIPSYFIINQNNSTNLSQEVADALSETGIPLLGTSLRTRVSYREAVIKGLGVYEYKDEKAKAEIVGLAEEVLAKIELIIHSKTLNP
jgi:chromosome partitioning protein